MAGISSLDTGLRNRRTPRLLLASAAVLIAGALLPAAASADRTTVNAPTERQLQTYAAKMAQLDKERIKISRRAFTAMSVDLPSSGAEVTRNTQKLRQAKKDFLAVALQLRKVVAPVGLRASHFAFVLAAKKRAQAVGFWIGWEHAVTRDLPSAADRDAALQHFLDIAWRAADPRAKVGERRRRGSPERQHPSAVVD